MEVPGNASGVYIFECIASEASTANPLKKRAFRRPMDQVGTMRIVCCYRFLSNATVFSLLTSTTQERLATCSSTARMAARLYTTTFRYPQDYDH